MLPLFLMRVFLALGAFVLSAMVHANPRFQVPVDLVDPGLSPDRQEQAAGESIVQGTVTEWLQGGGGEPVGGVEVGAYLSWDRVNGALYQTTTQADGSFSFPVRGEHHRLYVKVISPGWGNRGASHWSAFLPENLELMVMRTRQGELSIHCTQVDGNPAVGAMVTALVHSGSFGFAGASFPRGVSGKEGGAVLKIPVHAKPFFVVATGGKGELAGPTFVKGDFASSLPPVSLVLREPARVRIHLTKKYPIECGALSIRSIGESRKVKWEGVGGVSNYSARFWLTPEGVSWKQVSFGWSGGEFDLAVPAITPCQLQLTSESGWSAAVKIPSLTPGQIHEVHDVVLTPGPAVFGKVVGSEGLPIVGARVRGLSGWNPKGASLDWDVGLLDGFFIDGDSTFGEARGGPPLDQEEKARRRAHRETITDQNGQFLFRLNQRMQSVPLEVTASIGVNAKVAGLDDWQGLPRQHYPEVAQSEEETTLVFDPVPVPLKGRLVDHSGQPVVEFDIETRAKGMAVKLSYSDEKWDHGQEKVDWYVCKNPQDYESSNLPPSGTADGNLIGPPYSPPSFFSVHDVGGEFSIAVLPSGTYQLTVSAPGLPPLTVNEVRLPLEKPLELRLPPPTSLHVVAQDSGGDPLPRMEMDLWGPLVPREGTAFVSTLSGVQRRYSSQAGRASWLGLIPGRYELRSRDGHRVRMETQAFEIAEGQKRELVWAPMLQGGVSVQLDWPDAPEGVRAELSWVYSERPPLANMSHRYPRKLIMPAFVDGVTQRKDIRTGKYEMRFVLPDKGDRPSDQKLDAWLKPIDFVVRTGEVTQLVAVPHAVPRCLHGVVRVGGERVSNGSVMLLAQGDNAPFQHSRLNDRGEYRLVLHGVGPHRVYFVGPVPGHPKMREYQGFREIDFHGVGNAAWDLDLAGRDVYVRLLGEKGEALTVPAGKTAGFAIEGEVQSHSWSVTRKALVRDGMLYFPSTPPGRYRLVRSKRRADFRFAPAGTPEILVEASPGPLHLYIESEPQYSLNGQVDLIGMPDSLHRYITVWADEQMENRLHHNWLSPTGRFSVDQLPGQEVWLTVETRRKKVQLHFQKKERPTLRRRSLPAGPFHVKDLAGEPIAFRLYWKSMLRMD